MRPRVLRLPHNLSDSRVSPAVECNSSGWRVVDPHDRMPTASAMAESTPHDERSEAAAGGPEPRASGPDPGAPIAPDQIDPELIKLARARPRVGVITAAGLVFLCIVFLWRLGPDRRFAGSGAEPRPVRVADVLAGQVD